MIVKKHLTNFFFLSQIVFLSSCSTIFSSTDYNLSVKSEPSEAKFKVENREGSEVYSGKTPSNVNLDASAGFFKKQSYRVKFANYDRVEQVKCSVDISYWFNLLWGTLAPIPFFIIDPATGAMYKLKNQHVLVNLTSQQKNDYDQSSDSAPEDNNENQNKKKNEELVDVVYLKNGSIIHGEIVKINPGENVKIKIESGNLFVYEMDEVKKITKEKLPE
jgi:anti-sigma28 factor (negative regulator of flagellin synthesis)